MSTEDRLNAISWWNSLSFIDKWDRVVQCKHLIFGYPDRDISTLTGREIESIWFYCPNN